MSSLSAQNLPMSKEIETLHSRFADRVAFIVNNSYYDLPLAWHTTWSNDISTYYNTAFRLYHTSQFGVVWYWLQAFSWELEKVPLFAVCCTSITASCRWFNSKWHMCCCVVCRFLHTTIVANRYWSIWSHVSGGNFALNNATTCFIIISGMWQI